MLGGKWLASIVLTTPGQSGTSNLSGGSVGPNVLPLCTPDEVGAADPDVLPLALPFVLFVGHVGVGVGVGTLSVWPVAGVAPLATLSRLPVLLVCPVAPLPNAESFTVELCPVLSLDEAQGLLAALPMAPGLAVCPVSVLPLPELGSCVPRLGLLGKPVPVPGLIGPPSD